MWCRTWSPLTLLSLICAQGTNPEGIVYPYSYEAFRLSLWLLWATLPSMMGTAVLRVGAGALVVRKTCCAMMTVAAVLERWLRAS